VSVSSAGKSTPTEPAGVERLDPWMHRNPQYVAGIWTLFALASTASAIFSDGSELVVVLKLLVTLGWLVLAAREARRYRAQREHSTTTGAS
jgi:hypothetical protein